MKNYKKVEHLLIKRIYYVDWHIGGHGDNEIIDVEEIK